MKPASTEPFWKGIVKSLGLVFGDIGTSPIYTLTVIFALTKPTPDNVMGILSLVFWTMTILVTAEYAWLAMSLGRKGEGGTIVLREILVRLLKPGRKMAFVTFLSYVGVSLLLGDGVITPAISILSAVEGMILIPGLESLHQGALILIAAVIAVLLFIFQHRGTDRMAGAFGPIMVLWFLSLAVSGVVSVVTHDPGVVKAVSPLYALRFMMENGFSSFFVLSEVILCATGGEALYADMGHLGRKPIIRAWSFVFFALVINYLGQGAYVVSHGGGKNLLFGMVQEMAPSLYIPFLILTIVATVIASQAMISGVFSVVYQGITTRMMPLLKVDYTSSHLKSQIYIGSVNWMLLVAVICIMLIFRRSENLAAAYGLAVTGTMTLTGIMITMIYRRTTRKWKVPFAVLVTAVDIVFLAACLNKIPHGGYWSIILAAIPFAVILIWTRGQRALYRALRPLDLDTFLVSYGQIYHKSSNIPGTALFFTREKEVVPPYVVHNIISSNIIYQRNIFVSIVRTDEPFGVKYKLTEQLGPGLDALEVLAGYKEIIDLEKLLKKSGIQEKVIFYGIEDIVTNNVVWRLFSFIKRQTPNFVKFYKLPPSKLHGVVTRVEM
ncbi:KUP/HAK/KT family potassium transporter [Geobacter sp. DSM 9736]|uniref:KUP/HAK/KT family potassium transporter n=1 Tax=Geobacter sp. DSM 9736 TaxID=1277350 RepID=UPI000B509BA5|nr:KUP/HAK/KT family potassium transporter [Geobacter sp. DSM 9736]